jgi:thymidylate synthase (FAD)
MKGRHGSPFEHGSMTFRIQAPIFVWREFMRHRIGFSYNEQSGRYMELEPVFYLPGEERPLQQVGKAGAYTFVPGTEEQKSRTNYWMRRVYRMAWLGYRAMLVVGVAKEVARMVLPVGIYSTAYVTCNPRSMMSFLSLRTKDLTSLFPSFPQYEIEQVALAMEDHFKILFPTTYDAWNNNGRVAP